MEELLGNKKKRKLIINESSEATYLDQSVETNYVKIETIDMEQ
jgi:hypothetical protein